MTINAHIKDVKTLEDYQREFEFQNGEHRVFDMKPYLNRGIFIYLKISRRFKPRV